MNKIRYVYRAFCFDEFHSKRYRIPIVDVIPPNAVKYYLVFPYREIVKRSDINLAMVLPNNADKFAGTANDIYKYYAYKHTSDRNDVVYAYKFSVVNLRRIPDA